MPKMRLDLRCVVYKEGDLWFAHCLELDIVAEGKTPHEALADLMQLCIVQIEFATENGDIKTLFKPAPSEFWAMYSHANPLPQPSLASGFPDSLEVDVDARELAHCG